MPPRLDRIERRRPDRRILPHPSIPDSREQDALFFAGICLRFGAYLTALNTKAFNGIYKRKVFMKKAAIYAAALVLTLTAIGKPAENGAVPGEWTMDFDAARKVAAEKKLPIFINFTGSDWCGWCKHMEKEVFAKQEWLDYAKESLMLVWIDFPKDQSLVPEKYRERNRQLSETFEVGGYPTYVILDDNGRDQLGELQAEQQITPQGFIGKLKPILAERQESLTRFIAQMPAAEGAALKKACDERAAIRKEINELQNRMTQLGSTLSDLDGKIESMRTKALVDKMKPADASVYRNAQTELAAARKELQEWIATNPERNEENGKKFQSMNGRIGDLERRITALLYAE